MPPQTRSKLQLKPLYPYPMASFTPSSGDTYDDSPVHLPGRKDSDHEDWDPRFGAPIRPALSAKRKCVSVSVQTSPIEEICPPLCRDTGSTSSSPDPESDDGAYGSKHGPKRTQHAGTHAAKKGKLPKLLASPKPATPEQPRRGTIITLDGPPSKPRSIYAPSPTPLQCTYVYPIALGPPRRHMDLRRNKGAKMMPEAQVTPAATAGPRAASGAGPAAPVASAGTSIEGASIDANVHKLTHQCPITFSREFEMRRHIRTVHIAEEIRAVVEGRLPREQATVIPDNWDGKTLLSKPTCAGCGTTFSRPDAVRRHQTEVNAKMENGVCIECPGPKVHIRRGPRKDAQRAQQLSPGASPGPGLTPALAGLALTPIAPAIAPAPAVASAPAPAPVPSVVLASGLVPDAAPASAAPTSAEPQIQPAAKGRAESAEGELESEDDM